MMIDGTLSVAVDLFTRRSKARGRTAISDQSRANGTKGAEATIIARYDATQMQTASHLRERCVFSKVSFTEIVH
jgi:hypothetical protein